MRVRAAYLREWAELGKAGRTRSTPWRGGGLAQAESVLRTLGATPDQIVRERERVRADLFGEPATESRDAPPPLDELLAPPPGRAVRLSRPAGRGPDRGGHEGTTGGGGDRPSVGLPFGRAAPAHPPAMAAGLECPAVVFRPPPGWGVEGRPASADGRPRTCVR